MTKEDGIEAILGLKTLDIFIIRHVVVVSHKNVPLSCGVFQNVFRHLDPFSPLLLKPVAAIASVVYTPTGAEWNWLSQRHVLANVVTLVPCDIKLVRVQKDELDCKILVLHSLRPVWCRSPPVSGMPSMEDGLIPTLSHTNATVIMIAQHTEPRLAIHTLPTVHCV